MKSKLREHLLSLIFVSAIMITALIMVNHAKRNVDRGNASRIGGYVDIPGIELGDPFQKTLLREALNVYFPGRQEKNDSLMGDILQYRENRFRKNLESVESETLSFPRLIQILGMYLKFLLIYMVVMALTYYGVQTMGVWRFVRRKARGHESPDKTDFKAQSRRAIKTGAKGLAYLVLFSPSYVIAYSIRTEFSTDSLLFMIFLGVVSNGLLVTYANKFYNFLVTESRKGYIETARVKNLDNGYRQEGAGGIPWKAILKLRKRFDGHVFGHIFQNARYQYISTLKEQAAFLITGLIIIEMALNIHGHFSYDMLRQMLYKNYDIVIVFFLGIFYTVKLTEMLADWAHHREAMRYENR